MVTLNLPHILQGVSTKFFMDYRAKASSNSNYINELPVTTRARIITARSGFDLKKQTYDQLSLRKCHRNVVQVDQLKFDYTFNKTGNDQ